MRLKDFRGATYIWPPLVNFAKLLLVVAFINLKGMTKVPTCFKFDRAGATDLIFTSRTFNFQNTMLIEAYLTKFYSTTVLLLKVFLISSVIDITIDSILKLLL